MGNAKLNIGDANGFGLEWIFRGQCHWGKYKDMEALIIQGPLTNFKPKIQIISRLWSVIYDMKLKTKSQSEIDKELDALEYECRKYADSEDEELFKDHM